MFFLWPCELFRCGFVVLHCEGLDFLSSSVPRLVVQQHLVMVLAVVTDRSGSRRAIDELAPDYVVLVSDVLMVSRVHPLSPSVSFRDDFINACSDVFPS